MQTIRFTPRRIIINGHTYNRRLIEKIILQASQPEIDNIAMDCFSGVGGVTEGFSRLRNWKVIACINHWSTAIQTHKKNHPDCLHLLEDFKVADITIIQYMIAEIRKRNPEVRFHLWMSWECTNFSGAKGGQSRDADSRTLAEHADRYIEALMPDKIWGENVKEFLLWGPMIPKVTFADPVKKTKKGLPKNVTVKVPLGIDAIEYYNSLIAAGKNVMCPLVVKKPTKALAKKGELPGVYKWMIPCPYRKGQDFNRWKEYMCSFGYDVEYKLLNCADYGVPQHRIRLIMQFVPKSLPITWPVKTHDKNGKNGLPKWNPVRDCLNLEEEGTDVLDFIMQKGALVPRIKSEATIDRLILGNSKHGTGKHGQFIVKYLSNDEKTGANPGVSIDSASSTVTCQNRLALAKSHQIDHYFGNGYTKPITDVAGVSGTKDGIALQSIHYVVNTTHFMDMQYSSGQQNKSIDDVSGALLGVPKNNLVRTEQIIMDTQFNNGAHPLDQPSRTQTANGKHFYLVNFQWFQGAFRSLEEASNTIIARMDKAPNYLIVIETGELAIQVFDHDPPHYRKLKKYMAENGIVRITMRMLFDTELLKIMSMNPDTKLSKSTTANKKMIGNAVPPDLVEALGEADRQHPIQMAA